MLKAKSTLESQTVTESITFAQAFSRRYTKTIEGIEWLAANMSPQMMGTLLLALLIGFAFGTGLFDMANAAPQIKRTTPVIKTKPTTFTPVILPMWPEVLIPPVKTYVTPHEPHAEQLKELTLTGLIAGAEGTP
jgi:hypothetical protein